MISVNIWDPMLSFGKPNTLRIISPMPAKRVKNGFSEHSMREMKNSSRSQLLPFPWRKLFNGKASPVSSSEAICQRAAPMFNRKKRMLNDEQTIINTPSICDNPRGLFVRSNTKYCKAIISVPYTMLSVRHVLYDWHANIKLALSITAEFKF
jgi:hypothetical protein